MRFLFTALIAGLVVSACGQDSGNAAKEETRATAATSSTAKVEAQLGTPAVISRSLPLAECLAEQAADADAASPACPSFILLALDRMIEECAAAEGKLQPATEPEAWVLDVDGDGKNEMLVDLNRNFVCYGAPSVSSCGSLGCPSFLYAPRGDGWAEIAAINAEDAPKIEVLAGTQGEPAVLRGGCAGDRPCDELTHYQWNGTIYERAWIEFRGTPVDVVPGGLFTLTKEAAVLTAPKKGSAVIDEYPAGTAMVVLGNARGQPYQYVSPCNACRKGFVETVLLAK